MRKIVGFAGRSLAEMEDLYRGVDLFYFYEAQAHGDPVDEAKLWFAPDDVAAKRLMNALSTAGLDTDPIFLSLQKTTNWYALHVKPTDLVAWDARHFDRLRAIEIVIRDVGLPLIERPHPWRAFYRGQVVD